MSYSYLKNVFPNFEASINYQNKVYNEININNDKDQKIKPIDSSKLDLFTQSLIGAPYVQSQRSSSQPVPLQSVPSTSIQKEQLIEKFESDSSEQQYGCDMYMRHVLGCHKCRSILLKQWNIESDRLRNEEIMELVTYIVFGIFILVLIDILKNK